MSEEELDRKNTQIFKTAMSLFWVNVALWCSVGAWAFLSAPAL